MMSTGGRRSRICWWSAPTRRSTSTTASTGSALGDVNRVGIRSRRGRRQGEQPGAGLSPARRQPADDRDRRRRDGPAHPRRVDGRGHRPRLRLRGGRIAADGHRSSSRGETTVLLEPGPPVPTTALERLETKVSGAGADGAGGRHHRLAAARRAGGLRRPARRVRARAASDAFVAVDTSGEALAAGGGGRSAPDQGQPRRVRARVSRRPDDRCRRRAALPSRWPETVCETLCLTDGRTGRARPLRTMSASSSGPRPTDRVSTAGAGDAFLAGLLFALRRGDPCSEAARFASAAAAAALQADRARASSNRPTVEAALDAH